MTNMITCDLVKQYCEALCRHTHTDTHTDRQTDTYTDLFPLGWNFKLLMGPKWPLTRPISSSNTIWKNLTSKKSKIRKSLRNNNTINECVPRIKFSCLGGRHGNIHGFLTPSQHHLQGCIEPEEIRTMWVAKVKPKLSLWSGHKHVYLHTI